MPNAIDWYLVEVERRLRGRMPAQEVQSVLAETEDHLSEMGEFDKEQLVRKFGSPTKFALSMIRNWNEPQGTVWQHSRWTIVSVALSLPSFLALMLITERLDRSDFPVGWIIFTMALVVFSVAFMSRKNSVGPLAASLLALSMVSCFELGTFFTTPITSNSGLVPVPGVWFRFEEGGPKEKARMQLVRLLNTSHEIDRLIALAKSNSLEPSDLALEKGFKTSYFIVSDGDGSVLTFTSIYADFQRAKKTWSRPAPYIKRELDDHIALWKEIEAGKWSSLWQEAWFRSYDSVQFTSIVSLLALAGNWMGMLFRTRIYWQRRRYA